MSEYSNEEKYKVPAFTYPQNAVGSATALSFGEQAHLFSSVNKRTVLRHFEWMEKYGIDGVWLQRFVVDLEGGPLRKRYPSLQKVLHNVQEAASHTGRIWALAYDMAGMPNEKIFDVMISDWKKLVDGGITQNPRYLHYEGKPVLCIWGFYESAGNITPVVANRIIDFFKTNPKYGVFLVGGGDWGWHRKESERLAGYPLIDKEWMEFFRRFDVICPWNVGNAITENGKKWANTSYWEEGIKEDKKAVSCCFDKPFRKFLSKQQ